MVAVRRVGTIGSCVAALLVGACGGGSSNSGNSTPQPPPAPPPPTLDPQYVASAASPFASGCDGVPANGTFYLDAEVEPYLAVDPQNAQHLVGAWQQDRWSNGGARGIVAGVSTDGGHTWSRRALAFSRCGGGNAGNGADFERASDPWVTIGPDGTVHALAIAFSGFSLMPGSVSAIVGARSTDGGATWGAPSTLRVDADSAFNDKGSITADPLDARFVYAVWDRLVTENTGPTWLARSVDGGATWQAGRMIYDPGANNQTIANAIVVLPNGTLVDMFFELDSTSDTTFTSHIGVMRSTDNGETWSAPIKVADAFPVGTRDPETGASVRDSTIVPAIAAGAGGKLIVVWQDSRFSNGARDAIAASHSDDGGLTWSAPVRVNADVSKPAFSPTANVRSDGVFGVTYYDFRPNTTSAATLLTAYWLARSADAVTWQEHQVAGPFDLDLAPQVASDGSGAFLGDYQALGSAGTLFLPFFTRTNGSNANRTDIYIAPAVSATGNASTLLTGAGLTATATTERFVPSAELRQRVSENLRAALRQRLPRPGTPTP
jgi:BNR repeat-like domain